MTIQPFSSVYKYTDPIRYFKANDPYFYEVDNIPLKQLQENCNFLKDQINGLAGGIFETNSEPSQQGRIKRSDFDELLPYVNGTDSKVYVRPGKYIARINDAYSLTPLQIIKQILSVNSSNTEFNRYDFRTIADGEISQVLDKFKTSLQANSLSMNGLFERSFVRSMLSNDEASQYLLSSAPGYNTTPPTDPTTRWLPYPMVKGHNLDYNVNASSVEGETWNSQNGFLSHPLLESQFIKKWRGVTRTSVVNVDEVLSIDIPEFTDEDYFYIDRLGQRQQLNANQRIDLVFIYSKPIDAPTTTIAKFNNNSPTTINKPMLGIVKGAGIGLNLKRAIGANAAGQEIPIPDNRTTELSLSDIDGNQIILPNISDELGIDIGIGELKGSFPSPDDLMNLSPLLSENLENGHIALVGQTILPVAYVVRKKITEGIIPTEDLVDIRPFFRTTELSYNERSGLAAATPQVSLANPVASEGYVDLAVKEVNQRINSLAGGLPTGILTTTNAPRIIRSGYIKGGLRFGVESTLTDFLKRNQQTGQFASQQEMLNALRSIYDYPAGTTFRNTPDWDLAEWITRPGYSDRGSYETDFMNFAVARYRNDTFNTPHSTNSNSGGRKNTTEYGWGYGTSPSQTAALNSIYKRFAGYPNPLADLTHSTSLGGYLADQYPNVGAYYSLCFVKKSFIVRKAPWVADIRVDARLFNCCPMSFSSKFGFGNNDRRQMAASKFSNIWTSKRILSTTDVEVTIFVSWAVDLHGAEIDGEGLILPSFNRTKGEWFAGFLVLDNQMSKRIDRGNGPEGPWNPVVAGTYPNNIPTGFPTSVESGFSCQVGVALYPTVQFDIWAIPNSYGVSTDYGNPNNNLIIIPT